MNYIKIKLIAPSPEKGQFGGLDFCARTRTPTPSSKNLCHILNTSYTKEMSTSSKKSSTIFDLKTFFWSTTLLCRRTTIQKFLPLAIDSHFKSLYFFVRIQKTFWSHFLDFLDFSSFGSYVVFLS